MIIEKNFKKMMLVISIFIIAVNAFGCNKQNTDNAGNTVTLSPTEDPSYNVTDDTQNTESLSILTECLTQYDAEKYMVDAYVSMRYVLLCENQFIILTAIPGATKTTAIPYESISTYETVKLSDVSIITITDRSGEKYTVNLSSSDSVDFLDALNK